MYTPVYSFPKSIMEMPREILVALIVANLEKQAASRGHILDPEKCDIKDIIRRITKSLQSTNKTGLILSGGYGTGKTSIIRAIKSTTMSGSLKTANEIFAYFKAFETFNEEWRRGILFLDDVGSEPKKCLIYGEPRNPIAELLCARYDTNATTIITTNLSIEGIGKRYGDRVYDRMVEQYELIELCHPSFRSTIIWNTHNE